MCAIVDGYKLYLVVSSDGTEQPTAGIGHSHTLERATLRGLKPQTVKWHPLYRQYAIEQDIVEQSKIRRHIEDVIWNDVVEYP